MANRKPRRRASERLIRITTDLEKEDYQDLMDLGRKRLASSQAVLVRKAIRLLAALEKGEIFLTTRNGEKIPKSVIFS